MDLRPHVLNSSSTERFESIDKHSVYAYVDSSEIRWFTVLARISHEYFSSQLQNLKLLDL
jgi:hypothetical protein